MAVNNLTPKFSSSILQKHDTIEPSLPTYFQVHESNFALKMNFLKSIGFHEHNGGALGHSKFLSRSNISDFTALEFYNLVYTFCVSAQDKVRLAEIMATVRQSYRNENDE